MRSAMQIETGVPEVLKVFKEIQQQPERLFEIIRAYVGKECRSASGRAY